MYTCRLRILGYFGLEAAPSRYGSHTSLVQSEDSKDVGDFVSDGGSKTGTKGYHRLLIGGTLAMFTGSRPALTTCHTTVS